MLCYLSPGSLKVQQQQNSAYRPEGLSTQEIWEQGSSTYYGARRLRSSIPCECSIGHEEMVARDFSFACCSGSFTLPCHLQVRRTYEMSSEATSLPLKLNFKRQSATSSFMLGWLSLLQPVVGLQCSMLRNTACGSSCETRFEILDKVVRGQMHSLVNLKQAPLTTRVSRRRSASTRTRDNSKGC